MEQKRSVQRVSMLTVLAGTKEKETRKHMYHFG